MRKSLLKVAAATFVVGAVMAVSSVAVFAADTFRTSDFFDTYYSSKTSPTTATVTKNSTTVNPTSNYIHSELGTLAGGTVSNPNSLDFSGEMTATGNRTINVTPAGKGTVTVYWYTTDTSKSMTIAGSDETASAVNTVQETTYNCTTNTQFTIVYPKQIAFLGVDFEASSVESTDGKLTIVNNDDCGSYTVVNKTTGDTITDFTSALAKDSTIEVTITPKTDYEVASFSDSANANAALSKNVYTFGVDGDRTLTITYNQLTKFTESKTWDLSNGLVKGNNGDGLYAFEAMSYGNDGYVAGSTNPTVESDGTVSDGAGIKLRAGANGTLTITWKQSENNEKYGRCVEVSSTGTSQVYNIACSGSDEIAEIDVTEGNEYYFYIYGGSKVKIKSIVFQDETPYLDLVAKQNASTGKARLEATINNVSADNKITAISVQREDKPSPTAITNIKKTDDVYTFAVNFGTPTSDTHAVLSLTFLKGGTASTTKEYGFALNADKTIVLD